MSTQTIDVGAIFPTSGPQGPFFAAIGNGIRARFSVANAAGGIGGRQLVLHTADDGDGENENLLAAKYLVQKQKVFGIIEGTTNSDGSAGFLKDNNVPVTGWAITPAWGQDLNMFGYGSSTSPDPNGEPVTRAAQFLKAHGAMNVAVIAGGAQASVNYAQNFIDTLKPVGMALAYQNLRNQLGQTDYSADAQAMKKANADSLFLGTDTATSLAIIKAAKAAGVHLNAVLLPAGYDARLAAVAGSTLEGAYVEIDWRPFELPVPTDDEFKSALKAVAPNEFPGQLAMVGWLSADVFITGLQQAGVHCPTRSAFVHGLRQVKGYTAGGLLSPVDFATVFGKEPLCYWEVQFHDSKLVPVGNQPYCGVLLKDYHP